MASFNLVDEPFISCLKQDDTIAEFGLQRALLEAHEIVEIQDASPLVTIALHRLLLAILHRCYQGPKKSSDRIAIRNAGSFDAIRLNEYFQKWRERFDLFDEKNPFFQRAAFRTDEPSGINRLAQELACANNAMLFDHTTDDPPPSFSAAQAARFVIATQTYALGGGVAEVGNLSSRPSNLTHAPLVAGATVLIRGDTLFETLWLNLTIFDKDSKPVPCDADDAPNWERDPAEPHREPSTPRGYLDYLTWQSRTLRLHVEDGDGPIVVRRVSYSQGRKLETPAGFYDPMIAYSRNKADGDRPVRLQESRDLWRDSSALFQFGETDQFRGPNTLHTLAAVEIAAVLPQVARYRLSLFGLCTDKAKVNFWRHESLPLPLAYLDKPELVEQLKASLKLTEDVAKDALRAAVWAAAATRLTGGVGTSPDKKRVSSLLDSFAPERFYWSRLERPFREFLIALAAKGTDHSACIGDWYWNVLHPTAEAAFDESIGRIDGGRDLKAVNVGRKMLFSRLKKLRNDNHIPHREKEGAA